MIEVFGLSLRVYGLLIGLGIVMGAWVAARVARREGMGENLVWDGLVWVVVGGIVGARTYHVIDLWRYYSQNPWQIMAVWQGGLGIFGALLGGVVGLALFGWWQGRKGVKLELGKLLDVASMGIPIGQAIGRWGNFVNQELYGRPTDLLWGIYIDPAYRLVGYEEVARYHPLFLYESILSLVVFGVMVWVYVKGLVKVGRGQLLGVYLVGYGLVRMSLEGLRIEKWEIGDVPTASLVSGLLIVVGLILVARGRLEKRGLK